MGIETLVQNHGVTVAILIVFLWAFRKVLSSMLDDKNTLMDLVKNNTEAITDIKNTVNESMETVKEIHEFWRLRNGDLRKFNDKGGGKDD